MIRLTMESPRPVPSLAGRLPRKNGSKIRLRSASEIPGPVSSIWRTARESSRCLYLIALGDLLSQARTYDGFGLGTVYTSLGFLTVIVALVVFVSIGTHRAIRANEPA